MKSLLKAAICMVLIIAAIIPLTVVNASAAKPKISRTNVNVPIGYSITVKVTGASDVKWFSDNESVATVKADGASAKIYGKKTGSATISATAGNTTLKCRVTVKKSFIAPSAEKITLSKGKSKTVTLKVSGSKDIALSNSRKDVCSTSWGKWDGNTIKLTVKAKSEGKATIKVYAKGYTKSTTKEIVVNVGSSGDGEIIEDDEAAENSDKEQNHSDEVIELVNKERQAAGKPALKADDELNKIAAVRAKEISEKFSHIRPDGTKCFTAYNEAGYSYVAAAENIAYNYNDSADDIMDIWMNSSGHKANILSDDVTNIGVGYYEADGRYYWVQVFAK